MRVAIPRFGEMVAPCFEYSATIAIFSIRQGAIADQLDFTLQSRDEFDRVRLLRDQEVDVLICGGLRDRFEGVVRAQGIRVFSWVTGSVQELLARYLRGELAGERRRREVKRDA